MSRSPVLYDVHLHVHGVTVTLSVAFIRVHWLCLDTSWTMAAENVSPSFTRIETGYTL